MSKRRNPRAYNKFRETNCVPCSHNGSFYFLMIDHVKTLGSGGEDVKENCMTVCLSCHKKKGDLGVKWMADNYSNYKKWLISNGWQYDEFREKWVNYNLAKKEQ